MDFKENGVMKLVDRLLACEHMSVKLNGLAALLIIADKEGISVSELSERAGWSKSVSSYVVLDLGDKTRGGGKGPGLVKTKMEGREKLLSLTAKGKAVAEAFGANQ